MLTIVVETPYTRQQPTAAAHIRVRSLDDLAERFMDRSHVGA
jgi:hypothetical protein